MTDIDSAAPGDIRKYIRGLTIAAGVIALIVGLAILIWPLKSAAVVTLFIAIYTLVVGVVEIVLAIVSKHRGVWLRIGTAVLGVLFIVASISAFANLSSTAVLLAVFVTFMLGISWVLDGILTLFGLSRGGESETQAPQVSKGWAVAYAILSIIAGVVVLLSPLLTAVWLWLFIGISLVVFGIVQIVRGIRNRV